jgi:hypothetical protein
MKHLDAKIKSSCTFEMCRNYLTIACIVAFIFNLALPHHQYLIANHMGVFGCYMP